MAPLSLRKILRTSAVGGMRALTLRKSIVAGPFGISPDGGKGANPPVLRKKKQYVDIVSREVSFVICFG
jgi:hypothetical protein